MSYTLQSAAAGRRQRGTYAVGGTVQGATFGGAKIWNSKIWPCNGVTRVERPYKLVIKSI